MIESYMKLITAFGKTQTIKNWLVSEEIGEGVTYDILASRINGGMTPETAIVTPKKNISRKSIDQSPEEARGLFLFGYPMKYLHGRYRKDVRNFREYTVPKEPGKYTYYLSPDFLLNVHFRGGRFYYVVDGDISGRYGTYEGCYGALLEVTGGTEAVQE